MSWGRRFWLQFGLIMAAVVLVLSWAISQWQFNITSKLIAQRLVLLNELRKDALENYFHTAEAELRFWSISPDILSAQRDFAELWASRDSPESFTSDLVREFGSFDSVTSVQGLELASGGSAGEGESELGEVDYGWRHHQLHPLARQFVTGRGYYDFFLIGRDGRIYYSVEKEADFAASLTQGALAKSHLADVFQRALKLPDGEVAISDIQSYGPSNGDPAIFMALALRGSGPEPIGVIAFQLPTDEILQIMNYSNGMGETGETFLVGDDGLMRSNSRFSEVSTVLQQAVNTPTVALAFEGHTGYDYVADYRGVEVLSAYDSLMIDQTRWAVLAEMDRDEVQRFAANERPALAGVLGFMFGLSLWTAWYWRGRQMPGEGPELAGLDGNGSDFDGVQHSVMPGGGDGIGGSHPFGD